jgi:hypothetical protein
MIRQVKLHPDTGNEDSEYQGKEIGVDGQISSFRREQTSGHETNRVFSLSHSHFKTFRSHKTTFGMLP